MNVEVLKIKTLIEDNPTYSLMNIRDILDITYDKVKKAMKKLGYIKHMNYFCWIQRELSEKYLAERILHCEMLHYRNTIDPFLNRIITVFEKCIVYKTPASDQKKVMVSIWWDCRGSIFVKLLPDRTIIDTNTYCSHLDELKIRINWLRPELVGQTIMYHHSRPMVQESVQIRDKLIAFDWHLMLHPSYSFDLSPSDYFLNKMLHYFCRNKYFSSFEEFEADINNFCKRFSELKESPLTKLPERWQMVINGKGQYIEM